MYGRRASLYARESRLIDFMGPHKQCELVRKNVEGKIVPLSFARLYEWKGGNHNQYGWRWCHKISRERYEDQIRLNHVNADTDGKASCSGSMSGLSSFAHLALGGVPRGFLVPSAQ